MTREWLGVDLDRTLAVYPAGPGKGISVIGAPIPAMVERVKGWLAEGRAVRIVTARVCGLSAKPWSEEYNEAVDQRDMVESWCHQHLGVVLPVTASKDFNMVALYDDRAVTVAGNRGHLLAPAHDEPQAPLLPQPEREDYERQIAELRQALIESDAIRAAMVAAAKSAAEVTASALGRLERQQPLVDAALAYAEEPNRINLAMAVHEAAEEYRKVQPS